MTSPTGFEPIYYPTLGSVLPVKTIEMLVLIVGFKPTFFHLWGELLNLSDILGFFKIGRVTEIRTQDLLCPRQAGFPLPYYPIINGVCWWNRATRRTSYSIFRQEFYRLPAGSTYI